MAFHLLDLDWLNQNANRAYPLDDDAGRADLTGQFRLPDGFLLDLLWPIHASLDQDCRSFYLSSLLAAGDVLIGSISYAPPSGDPVPAGSFTLSRSAHQPPAVYAVTGVGEFSDSVGRVAVGDLDEVYREGGSLLFDLAGGRLNPTCVRPALRGVAGLTVRNGSFVSDRLTGDVTLEAGRGMRLTVLPGNRIRLDATSDEELREDCHCDDRGPCIRTINGVGPDDDGDFRLVGDACIRFEDIAHGQRLEDLCSKSCCGCEELGTVTTAAGKAAEQLGRLEAAFDQLDEKLDNSTDNLLASLANARGCPA